MTNTELFDLWRARAVEDPDLLTELDGIRGDADAINDRFYRDLAFGTGGLRGVIGALPKAWRTTSTPQACLKK